ncbi:MAG: hypothetical protein OXF98_04315 [Rhodospirillaceae bacterium]|nr:hypothetical protein [Rhodospirillaceae bacterium]
MDRALTPGERFEPDPQLPGRFAAGHRHLGCLQSRPGSAVKSRGMPRLEPT